MHLNPLQNNIQSRTVAVIEVADPDLCAMSAYLTQSRKAFETWGARENSSSSWHAWYKSTCARDTYGSHACRSCLSGCLLSYSSLCPGNKLLEEINERAPVGVSRTFQCSDARCHNIARQPDTWQVPPLQERDELCAACKVHVLQQMGNLPHHQELFGVFKIKGWLT